MAANGEFSVTPIGLETRRQLDDAVAVGIPDAEPAGQPGEKPARPFDRQRAVAVLAMVALRRRAAEQVTEKLDAIADAENRHPQFENPAIGHRGVPREHAARTAGKDDADHAVLPELRRRRREVIDLRINLALPDPARDHLGVLGAKINDGDCLCHVKLWREGLQRGNTEEMAIGKPAQPRSEIFT